MQLQCGKKCKQKKGIEVKNLHTIDYLYLK
jgi:hypothetical protein